MSGAQMPAELASADDARLANREHKRRQRARNAVRRRDDRLRFLQELPLQLHVGPCDHGADSMDLEAQLAAIFLPIGVYQFLPAGPGSANGVPNFWTAMPLVLTPDKSGLDGDIASETLLEQERLRQLRYVKKLRKKVVDGELSEAAMQECLGRHGRDARSNAAAAAVSAAAETQLPEATTPEPALGSRDLDVSTVVVTDGASAHNGSGLSLLSADRGRRKRQQVENFVAILAMRLREGNVDSLPQRVVEDPSRVALPLDEAEHQFPLRRIVDFGCGSGNLALSLAFLFPAIEFVCIDQNETSLELLKKRADSASLPNVKIIRWSFSSGGAALQKDLAWLRSEVGDFDLGIGLHCCGSFTDVVMELCAEMRAECIVCPCCNGRVGHGTVVGGSADSKDVVFIEDGCGQGVHYPRSDVLREHMSETDYTESLARWADDQVGAIQQSALSNMTVHFGQKNVA
eukprot:CAMPEP_0172814256 /NCGR_PEP_ID=MMETSP1075-20121228/11141_1 /TAXON_ID=2916 /ORGANISM="Ceratium fusus, Strain PA161109" /LENGTH=459 /DNA_ID=CAMNT_0013654045 /DNA_START=26 /DNA_END=1402 /DNA_ORIENTATION=+